jgi:serine/threonine protein kinase
MTQAPELREQGLRFGRYRLLERLGEGGMAVVFRAVLDGPGAFQRQVVLKKIRAEHTGDPMFVGSFEREAKVCGLLHHQGIVQVQDFGEVDGELFLAMELVEGVDLVQVLRAATTTGEDIPLDVVTFIALELASALGYAHALTDERGRPLGLVHRDISPSNIMITRQGAVKLLDFGVAKLTTSRSTELTRAGMIKGKLEYMSPEQTLASELDGRSDLFALGIVFYELLTTKRLFRGADKSETAERVRSMNPDPPSRLRPEVPRELDAIVLRLLAKDRDRRYRDAEQVAAELAPIARRLGAGALPTRELARRVEARIKPRRVETALAPTLPGAPPTGALSALEGDPTEAEGGTSQQAGAKQLDPTALSVLTPTTTSPESPSARGDTGSNLASMAMIVIALFVLSIAAILWARRDGGSLTPSVESAPTPTSTEPPAPVVVPLAPTRPPPAPAPPTPATVIVTVESPGASIAIDGVAYGESPVEAHLPAREGTRVIIAQAGSAKATRRVDADRDASVSLSVPKKPASPQRPVEIKDPFSR